MRFSASAEFQVVADRLLDDDAGPLAVGGQAGIVQEGGNLAEQERGRGHVENPLGFGAPFLLHALAEVVQLRVGRVALEVSVQILDTVGELAPLLGRGFAVARKLA